MKARSRRVLAWSLFVAAALHAAFFLLTPTFEVVPLDGGTASGVDLPRDSVQTEFAVPVYVLISYGPPEVLTSDGTLHPEPDDRILEAERLIRLPDECREPVRRAGELPSGRVRAWLNHRGEVLRTAVEESTGHACGDEVIRMVTDLLWYRWLPSDEYPWPVELVQPVALLEARS